MVKLFRLERELLPGRRLADETVVWLDSLLLGDLLTFLNIQKFGGSDSGSDLIRTFTLHPESG